MLTSLEILRCRWVERTLKPLLLVVAVGCLRFVSAAEPPVDVQTTLIAEVREPLLLASGQEGHRFAPATRLEQGQVVHYTVRIYNPTPVAVRDVAVVRRVPTNTVYLEGSAVGPAADVEFSADGGRTFASASRLSVTAADGTARRAQSKDYTHIRWRLRYPLAPGAVALARFRAVFQ